MFLFVPAVLSMSAHSVGIFFWHVRGIICLSKTRRLRESILYVLRIIKCRRDSVEEWTGPLTTR